MTLSVAWCPASTLRHETSTPGQNSEHSKTLALSAPMAANTFEEQGVRIAVEGCVSIWSLS